MTPDPSPPAPTAPPRAPRTPVTKDTHPEGRPNADRPAGGDGASVPDLRTLGLATAAALVVAVLLLVVAILPAEYGLDPTGLGAAMGLTGLSATAPAETEVADAATTQDDGYTMHNVTLRVPAGDDVEYKLHVVQGDGFVYDWRADGVLSYDLHGEPDGGAPGEFTRHKASAAPEDQGVLEVGFTGNHGWYFKNNSDTATTVTLRASGFFEVVGVV